VLIGASSGRRWKSARHARESPPPCGEGAEYGLEAQKGRGGVALSEVARILLIVLSAAVVALLVHRVAEAKMEVHLVKAVAADGIGTD
jgi:hypothetical protein